MNKVTLFEVYNGDEPFVFVSYSHEDRAVVFPEIKRLQEDGYRIWYDEGIEPAKEWPTEIANALLRCAFFLVFVSPSSVASRNVRNEINLACKENKEILAIHLEKTNLEPGLRLQIESVQAVLKYELADETYYRKLQKFLPVNIRSSSHEDAEKAKKILRFQTNYPNPVVSNSWQWLNLYVFLPNAQDAVEEDALAWMTNSKSIPLKESQKQSPVRYEDTKLKGFEIETPQLQNLIFNPNKLAFGFYEEWHRFDFKFWVGEDWLNKNIDGTLLVSLRGLPFSHISIEFVVGTQNSKIESKSTQNNAYQNIFVCYSHRDTFIVEFMEKAYTAFGHNYLRDVTQLRSGEGWDLQILDLIRKADVFHLFWSKSAAQSKYTEKQWRYALKLVQSGEKPDHFIRPVYWEKPIPAPPKELEDIHFSYIDVGQFS